MFNQVRVFNLPAALLKLSFIKYSTNIPKKPPPPFALFYRENKELVSQRKLMFV
jgi:hypothetical protein